MESFDLALLDKGLSPIEAIEFQSWLVSYLRANPNEIMDTLGIPLPSIVAEAQIVLWDEAMHSFAIDGQKLFAGVRVPDDLLSRQPELWIVPWTQHWDSSHQQVNLLYPDQEREELIEYLFDWDSDKKNPMRPLVSIGTHNFKPGVVLNDDIEKCFPEANILARIEFLNSPIVQSEKETLPRYLRRQAKRENVHEPIVRVIRLRRKERGQGSDSCGSIEYQHQWLVRPHWRNQYHPSTGERKPVFIDAYVKGPEDKPFKPPKNYVFKVDR